MARIGWAAVALLVVAIVVGGFVTVTTLLRERSVADTEFVRRPAQGEALAEYLGDGTPVWVIGLADGGASVVSAFSTHTPANLGKLLWWCGTAGALEDPFTGARYDPAGRYIGGPAPSGLPAYRVRTAGSRVEVGALGEAPPQDAPHDGPPESERDWCLLPEDAGAVSFHTFDGWEVHDSPTAAVAAEPEGWILFAGALEVGGNEVVLCAIDDCDDRVRADGIQPDDPDREFSALAGRRFIARVRDGVLVDLTRVIVPGP